MCITVFVLWHETGKKLNYRKLFSETENTHGRMLILWSSTQGENNEENDTEVLTSLYQIVNRVTVAVLHFSNFVENNKVYPEKPMTCAKYMSDGMSSAPIFKCVQQLFKTKYEDMGIMVQSFNLGRKTEAVRRLWVQGQHAPDTDFQDSQDCVEKSCLWMANSYLKNWILLKVKCRKYRLLHT